MYPLFEPNFSLDGRTIDSLQSDQADGMFFSSLDHDVSIFLIRHGQSEGNARNTYQGRFDFPLSAQGEEEARSAGEWLRQVHPDRIIASPMRRARRSAEIIAESVGIAQIEFNDILIELDVGLFSGVDPDTASRNHPDLWNEFYAHSWDAIPDAESSQALYARAMLAWGQLRENALQGASKIVCVTHGGLLQWLIKSTLGAHTWLPLFPISNCGISQYNIEIHSKGGPAFTVWERINFEPSAVHASAPPLF